MVLEDSEDFVSLVAGGEDALVNDRKNVMDVAGRFGFEDDPVRSFQLALCRVLNQPMPESYRK
jgi:hypothetical protein